jgi:hypothetical protein
MILISHRKNINGRFESLENEPSYIYLAISKNFDEINIAYRICSDYIETYKSS